MNKTIKNALLIALLGVSSILPKKTSASNLISLGYGYNGITNQNIASFDASIGNSSPYFHVGIGPGNTQVFSDFGFKIGETSMLPFLGYNLLTKESEDKNLSEKSINSLAGFGIKRDLESMAISLYGSSSEDRSLNFSRETTTSSERFTGADYDYTMNTEAITTADLDITSTNYDGMLSFLFKDAAELFTSYSDVKIKQKGKIDVELNNNIQGTIGGVPYSNYSSTITTTNLDETRNFSNVSIGVGANIRGPFLGSVSLWYNNNSLNGNLRLVFKTNSYKYLDDNIETERRVNNYIKLNPYSNISDTRVHELEKAGYEDTVIFSADTNRNLSVKYTGEDFSVGADCKNGMTSLTAGYKSIEVSGGSDSNGKTKANLEVKLKF